MASKTVSRLRSRLRRLNIGARLDFDVTPPTIVGHPPDGKHPLDGETVAQSTRQGTQVSAHKWPRWFNSRRVTVRVGLDPESYSGHSRRSDFLTSAAEDGASPGTDRSPCCGLRKQLDAAAFELRHSG